MKKKNIIRLLSLLGIFSMIAFTACDEAEGLSTDPVDIKHDFTFSPEAGYPGQIVTISGTGLNDVKKVSIGTAEAKIVDQDNEKLRVEVPVKASTGKIFLTFENKVYTSAEIFGVSSSLVPTITDFSPKEVSRGGEVTIQGSVLNRVKSVFINDEVNEILDMGEDFIKIKIHGDFTTDLIVVTYDYTTDYGMEKEAKSQSPFELVLLLPSIESIDDNVDVLSLNIGDELRIRGNAFDLLNNILFGDVEADEFEIKEDEDGKYVSVKVPAGATTGKIIFQADDGDFESPNSFRVLLPSIASFTPEKGSPQPGEIRPFAISGANLNEVTEVYVGESLAEIISQSNNQLLLSIDGDANGVVALHSANGIVNSIAPFAFVGDFWVTDWDANHSPVFDRFASNNIGGGITDAIVEDGGNNYAQIKMSNLEHSQSFYLWGTESNDDRFKLYVSNPVGVYFEFDVKVEEVDEAILDENGNIQVKIFTMDSKGWSADVPYSYGASSPIAEISGDGEWNHVRLHLNDFTPTGGDGGAGSGLYTMEQGTAIPGAHVFPNSLRIMTFLFGYNTDEVAKTDLTIGLDNIKFVIE